ncbi:MAG TPA: dienelactone hydrolase family protein [Planctomycetota bacterium]|nr:dienelactone hydrolase family protein [Planctomycetota bacterium]
MKMLIVISMLALAATLANAEVRAIAAEYRVGDTVLEGYFAYDDAVEGRRPGVLVVHEWWGLNDYAKRRARELAELGYVAFAVDMYGKGVLAKERDEAGKFAGALRGDRTLMRARVNAALEVLKGHALCDAKRTAAIGYCFGGGVVLELARSGADVTGVVSFHGNLDTPDPADAKNIKAKVLVCHGADDPVVPAEQVLAFEKEMRDAKVDWQMIVYGGAVHAFTNRDAGASYNAKADARSWQHMRLFFAEVFAE